MKRLLLASALLLTAQAPAPAPAPAADPVVAQSGDQKLTASEVRTILAGAEPATRAQVVKDPATLAQLVRSEMLRRELLVEAKQKKWDQSADIVARVNAARDNAIINTYVASITQPPSDYPSEADISAAYEANKAKFVVPRQFHLAQIFVPSPSGAEPSADQAVQRKLAELRVQLMKPKADFTEAVRKNSDASAQAKDGDLGWLREDQLVGPVKDAVVGLQEGGITPPVRAQNGWHLIKLVGTKPSAPAPLSDVHDNLAQALRQQKQAQNEKQLADDMQKKQPVQLDEIALSKAVQ